MPQTTVEIPDRLVADTLNNRGRQLARGHLGDDKVPRLHVSSLIKSGSADFFCAREFVLRYMERRELGGNSLPPKFALLYAVGTFYGEYIVQEFLKRNPEFAQYAWGDWRCRCEKTVVTRKLYSEVADCKCETCDGALDFYLETDLFNPQKTVVGHADLILLIDGVFYIYEFKTIDRADIVFTDINAPLGDHLLQASNYYYMLKSEGHKVSRRLRFVYVDRSMAGLYTHDPFREVYADVVKAERLSNIYNRAKLCHSSISKKTLPERKCASVDCARAKQCSVAVSCFSRTRGSVQRIPLDLTPPSPRLASTASPSTTKNGTASPLKRNPKTAPTQAASKPLRKKLSKS